MLSIFIYHVEYEVTLSLYSGLPDPSWKIHPGHESLKKIKEHHERAKSSKLSYPHHRIEAKLGYRGFLVHHKDSEHPDLIVGPHTQEFQKALLDTMPKELKKADLHQRMVQMISTSKAPSEAAKPEPAAPAAPPLQARGTPDAPPLDLAKWNTDPSITWNNNCYNYGNDQITNTFAQPGRASGHPIQQMIANEVKAAAISDGLAMLNPQPQPGDPSPSTSAAPPGWWNVALVVAPGIEPVRNTSFLKCFLIRFKISAIAMLGFHYTITSSRKCDLPLVDRVSMRLAKK